MGRVHYDGVNVNDYTSISSAKRTAIVNYGRKQSARTYM
jgi:hypothetical protein